jgi:archaellum biogenesis ATPase FlaH
MREKQTVQTMLKAVEDIENNISPTFTKKTIHLNEASQLGILLSSKLTENEFNEYIDELKNKYKKHKKTTVIIDDLTENVKEKFLNLLEKSKI